MCVSQKQGTFYIIIINYKMNMNISWVAILFIRSTNLTQIPLAEQIMFFLAKEKKIVFWPSITYCTSYHISSVPIYLEQSSLFFFLHDFDIFKEYRPYIVQSWEICLHAGLASMYAGKCLCVLPSAQYQGAHDVGLSHN